MDSGLVALEVSSAAPVMGFEAPSIYVDCGFSSDGEEYGEGLATIPRMVERATSHEDHAEAFAFWCICSLVLSLVLSTRVLTTPGSG